MSEIDRELLLRVKRAINKLDLDDKGKTAYMQTMVELIEGVVDPEESVRRLMRKLGKKTK